MEESRRFGLKYALSPLGFDTIYGKQDFAYGRFEWLKMPDETMPDGITIGRCTIEPRGEWPEHHHGGYEQALYVLSGRGVHWVGGERRELRPGMVEYLPVGTTHRVLNDSDEPLVHLSVYHPTMPREVRNLTGVVQDSVNDQAAGDFRPEELLPVSAMQVIQDKFAAAVRLGVIMIDANGRSVTKPTGMPEFCQYMRSRKGDVPYCRAFDPATGRAVCASGKPAMIDCCSGLVSVVVPFKAGDKHAGHIACGFVRIEEPGEGYDVVLREKAVSLGLDPDVLVERYLRIPVTMRAQMVAVADTLESIANSIVSLSLRAAERRLESERNAEMVKRLQLIHRLEREIQEYRFRALEARVNPHFLFNSLNAIAEAAAEGDRSVKDMVYALSDFLRFSIRNTKSTTSLREEMRCVENYLHIESARFGTGLKAETTVDPPEANPMVPSMILQPLVENAIVHGLAPLNYNGVVRVSATVSGGRVRVVVSDSGVGFRNDLVADLHLVEWLDDERPAMGLKYVRAKMSHTFGEDYSFVIESAPGKGATVTLEMPAREEDCP